MRTLTAPIHAGRTYTLLFENDISSTGAVLFLLGWVPQPGSFHLPGPQIATVAPGSRGELVVTVPASELARRLTVIVSLDSGETGHFTVLEGQQPHTSRAVTESTMFEMPVDP